MSFLLVARRLACQASKCSSRVTVSDSMAGRRSYASMVGGGHDSKAGAKGEDEKSTKTQNNGNSSASNQHKPQSHTDHQPDKHDSSQTKSTSQTSPPRGRNKNHPNSKPSAPYSATEYIRAPQHIPNTTRNAHSPSRNGDTEHHYILTLQTTPNLHNYMTSLRKKYFPPEINKLDAHVSLFHALPGSKLPQIINDIEDLCFHESPFEIVAEDPKSIGSRNILVRASSPHFAIEGVQKQLRTKWETWLSDQDHNTGFRPHWTVLNKVKDKEAVEKALDGLKGEFERTSGRVEGLVLWRYEKGWWKDRRVFEFEGGKKGAKGKGKGNENGKGEGNENGKGEGNEKEQKS